MTPITVYALSLWRDKRQLLVGTFRHLNASAFFVSHIQWKKSLNAIIVSRGNPSFYHSFAETWMQKMWRHASTTTFTQNYARDTHLKWRASIPAITTSTYFNFSLLHPRLDSRPVISWNTIILNEVHIFLPKADI